jgi:hypothetical protein
MQRQLVNQFDADIISALDGMAAAQHAAGKGRRFGHLCRGNDHTRPPVVTLEPRRDGLFLGMVISRPRGGKMVYEKTLGRWDFSEPIVSGGPLDAANPLHRRVAFWACNMAEKLLKHARAVRAGTAAAAPAPVFFPRILIPFYTGQEQFNEPARIKNPDALVDTTSMPGLTLVDSSIVPPAEVADAINNNRAWEDHRPVLGEFMPNRLGVNSTMMICVNNPTRAVLRKNGITQVENVSQAVLDVVVADFRQRVRHAVPDETVYEALLNPGTPVRVSLPAPLAARKEPEQFLLAARTMLGALNSAVSDDDIFNAVANPQGEMYASLKPRTQVVSVEELQEPPAPYSGSAIPPVNWRSAVRQRLVPSLQ